MSDDDLFRTLAYKKSPKASRRTTFQDELEAAVSARAQRNKHEEPNTYSDDFEDDDVLTEILNRRKKKLETLRKSKGKKHGKVQDFPLSDEEENARPKKVSFLKSKKTSSPVEGQRAEKGETEKTTNSIRSELSESAQSTLSSGKSESGRSRERLSISPGGQSESPADKRGKRDQEFSPQWGPSESVQSQEHSLSQNVISNSSVSGLFHPENTERESLSPQLFEGGQRVMSYWTESSEHDKTLISAPQGPPLPHPRDPGVKEKPTTDTVTVEGPPKPKPRQRMLRAGSPVMDERPAAEQPPSPTLSSSLSPSPSPTKRAGTSSSSSSGKRGPSRHGPQVVKRDPTASSQLSWDSSSAGDGISVQKSAEDSPSKNGLGESEEVKEETYSVCFEEHEESADRPDGAGTRLSNALGKTDTIRPSSAQTSSSKKSGRGSSRMAKSKYLGSLQVLDQQPLDAESKPEAASLRAAVYQEWLRKKQEKLREELQIKRKEEKQKEEKKREEELSKSQAAKASYEAWKEKKKETTNMKVKEKLETIRKQESEMNEKEEKKETAKKVFEKWKQEQDKILKERIRKQTKTENKLKQKKEMETQERKNDASAAFTKWSEIKKDVIQEKMKTERRKEKEKHEEDQYEKEERDQMALEMYEKWMRRKEFQQKREKNERRIQAILQDEPRPAWSPPNKTVPFGK